MNQIKLLLNCWPQESIQTRYAADQTVSLYQTCQEDSNLIKKLIKLQHLLYIYIYSTRKKSCLLPPLEFKSSNELDNVRLCKRLTELTGCLIEGVAGGAIEFSPGEGFLCPTLVPALPFLNSLPHLLFDLLLPVELLTLLVSAKLATSI